jgi:hypothetical protein
MKIISYITMCAMPGHTTKLMYGNVFILMSGHTTKSMYVDVVILMPLQTHQWHQALMPQFDAPL